MYSLLGHPLDLVVGGLDADSFTRLYATGDKIIRKRIIKCPANCREFPVRFSENVRAITNCFIGEFEANKGHFVYNPVKGNKFGRLTHVVRSIPATLVELKVICSNDIWNCLVPLLPNLEKLGINLKGNYYPELMQDFRYPQKLKELTITSPRDNAMFENIPLSVTFLNVQMSDGYMDNEYEGTIDIEYLVDLEKFQCVSSNQFSTTKELVEIDAPDLHVSGHYPKLRSAIVNSLEGTYPVLMSATIHEGTFPLLNRNCSLERREWGLYTHLRSDPSSVRLWRYENGKLSIDHILGANIFEGLQEDDVVSIHYTFATENATLLSRIAEFVSNVFKQLPPVSFKDGNQYLVVNGRLSLVGHSYIALSDYDFFM